MMNNRYVYIAAVLILVIFLLYVLNFYIRLGYVVSDNPDAWGQLGEYVGGVLSPLLSFMSLVLIIKSLTLQNEANRELRDEIVNSRKTEKLRSFESQFFHMIDSQRSLFKSLMLEAEASEDGVERFGASAVISIEEEVEKIRKKVVLLSLVHWLLRSI